MKTSALIWGFIVACVVAFTGCGDNTDHPPAQGKELTTFGFLVANNPGLTMSAPATISGDTISATVPFGTNVTALVATFETTGASVTVGGVAQVSGVTANNFSSSLTYQVTATDSTTRAYTVTVTVAPSSTKQLTTFAFLAARNAGLGNDVTATINGSTIAATVPFGTSVTALVATFTTNGASVTVAGTAQVSGTTANNFTSPVTYRVTAGDGTTQDYTVTVTVAPSSAKAIATYAFLSVNNPGLGADFTATINGTAIAATVPFGTNVTGLVATFTTTGASVTVNGTAQVSGTTANNFSAPVAYKVTAADGSNQIFTVTVTVAPSNAKAITTYAFLSANNPGLTGDVTATINGTAISATVPFGTTVTNLVATFTTTGASVAVGATTQVSGTTANNFTTPVAYTVTAADNTTAVFTVTVAVALNPAKAITAYAFLSANNPALTADVTATITGTTITATVPFGTNVTSLIATFTTTGTSVTVGGTTQVSGITANNFSSPVTYRVTAADGSTLDHTVTVNVAPSPAKAITAYAFLSARNPGLPTNVTATINGTTIAATVPFGTDVTALVATFTTTGASVAVGGTTQTSGITANDFSTPVAYTVTAADGTTAVFTVTVTVASNTEKDITAYAFLSVNNPGLTADVTATINGTTIAATVPFGTDVTGLIATFSTTGATVDVGGILQISDITGNDFTTPVVYTVTAMDGSTQDFTVTVTVARNTAKAITDYEFLSVNNPVLGADVTATINGTAIAATVPFGTDVTNLVASFLTTGVSVTVGGTPQVSGVTANNFTSPVAYTVTADDGSTAVFTVTVTVALNPAKAITAYSFRSVNNAGLPADVIATINGTAITATVPFGTNVTALIATFSTTGASVTVAGTLQVSGITANNFTSPVIYRVTAADGSTLDHTVTITVAPSPAKDITAYSFRTVNNPTLSTNVTATITGTAIAATVPFGTDVTTLIATFTTTGASVTVGGTAQVSGITANNFTTPVAYTVTAADGSTAIFTVTVTVAVLQSIAVTPANSSVVTGSAQQFTAIGTFSDTTTQNLTTQVTWASSNLAVALISNASGSAGLATTLAVGTTTISANLNGVSGSTTLTVTAPTGHLIINEIDYDQTINPDAAEFVEIYNPTAAPITLANKALVLVNGANNMPYTTVDLGLAPVTSLASHQYLIVAGPSVTVMLPAVKLLTTWTTDAIQNGAPDGVALIDTAAHTLIDALSYEGAITTVTFPGFASPVSLVEGTVLPIAVADSNTTNGSLCRSPDGVDTDNAATDWKFCTTLSPGTANP